MVVECVLSSRRDNKSCTGCTNLCEHRIAIKQRIINAKIPVNYQNKTLDSFADLEHLDIIKGYVKSFRRIHDDTEGSKNLKSLYLYSSNTGTGKTTTACIIAIEYIMTDYIGRTDGINVRPVLYLNVADLQNSYALAVMAKDEDEIKRIAELTKQAAKVDMLVFDDIGVTDGTNAFTRLMYYVIDKRNTYGLPTIYTSNEKIERMSTVFDKRIYDRIRDRGMLLEFSGTSKRGGINV